MVSIRKFRIIVLVSNRIEYWSNCSIRFKYLHGTNHKGIRILQANHNFPDFPLTNVTFPDFSRFSRLVVTPFKHIARLCHCTAADSQADQYYQPANTSCNHAKQTLHTNTKTRTQWIHAAFLSRDFYKQNNSRNLNTFDTLIIVIADRITFGKDNWLAGHCLAKHH